MTRVEEGRATTGGIDERWLERQWEGLEAGLTAYLATMTDPSDSDQLLIQMSGQDGSRMAGRLPYATFTTFDRGQMIRAEIAGDSQLERRHRAGSEGRTFFGEFGWAGAEPVGDSEGRNWRVETMVEDAFTSAHVTVRAMRDLFEIAHPHLLTQHARGPAADGVGVLGLRATTDQLTKLVAELLVEKYAVDVQLDNNGDFCLERVANVDQPIWVRVRKDQPAIEVFARVAHDVRSRQRAAVELSLLNRDSLWVRWSLTDRTVWQSIVVPALPFAPMHLAAMLDLFVQSLMGTRDDLAFRIRAGVA